MTVTNENSTTPIWNCLSTKITYMEIWKAWPPRHISYSPSSMLFSNAEMVFVTYFTRAEFCRANSAPQPPFVFPLSRPQVNTPTQPLTHQSRHTQQSQLLSGPPRSLTCFECSGALLADDRATAYRGAGAQVELVLAHRLQFAHDPLGGGGVADVDRLQCPHLISVVD